MTGEPTCYLTLETHWVHLRGLWAHIKDLMIRGLGPIDSRNILLVIASDWFRFTSIYMCEITVGNLDRNG